MDYIMPALIGALIVYALIKRVNVYEAFVSGAMEALPLMAQIAPYMAAMMAALGVMRATGALDSLISFIAPALSAVGMPPELTPLFTLRPFSGSAATALLNDVFVSYGTDGYVGLAASLMLGSTETIFYTVALYFGSVNVRKTRGSIPAALISGVAGAWAALVFARLMTG